MELIGLINKNVIINIIMGRLLKIISNVDMNNIKINFSHIPSKIGKIF